MYELLRRDMTNYYRKMDISDGLVLKDKAFSDMCNEKRNIIFAQMDEFYECNPDTPNVLLKSRIHTLMAELCEPVIFKNNPFYFEMGYNHSRSWGLGLNTPSYWLKKTKHDELLSGNAEYAELTDKYSLVFDRKKVNLCTIDKSFDDDHHTLGYTKLFDAGIKGLRFEVERELESAFYGSDKFNFLTAVLESFDAIIKIAHKFSEKAEKLASETDNKEELKCLNMIAETALKIPENPPQTFYEGLAMLIFTREVISELENMGLSHLGHVDRLLGDLLENDLKSGRLTVEEASELVTVWMMYTDIKFDVDNQSPETSTCIQLGGCDENGNEVFNQVTKIFLDVHHKNGFINPKLNCRISPDSSEEYLSLVSTVALDGHNSFAFINDNMVIDSLMRRGVELKDARLYVNGGCQETMIEGCGHTEGAGLYISMLRIFDLFLRKDADFDLIKPTDKVENFEDFYTSFIEASENFIRTMLKHRNLRQSFYKNVIACPLFSSTQNGCIENGMDYVHGGAKYNFSTVALVGLANLADSLYTIKKLVFEQRLLTFNELIRVMDVNWEGYDDLRERVLALPKYGHGEIDVDKIADRILHDFSRIINNEKNERGGSYIPSPFVYNNNRLFAPCLRATPDGRKDFDYLAAGCSPSTLKKLDSITDPVRTMGNIDLGVCAGISVLDMMMPISKGFDEKIFAGYMRTFCQNGGVTLQPNFLNKEDLVAAKSYPEKYKNLIIRVCGYSVRFVNLPPEAQDEIICRNYYSRC